MQHRPLSLCLVLMLAIALTAMLMLTGAAGAREAARGPVTQAVICAHGSTEVVLLDASGRQVDPARDCCARGCTKCLPSAVALPAPTTQAAPLAIAGRHFAWGAGVGRDLCSPAHVRARGPPLRKA
ncbi:hypothetical protein [Rhodobacter sp. NSM]|uniref:hypothetical protein n=1 Tax=Rhodobacter sp. NSM TaxID=3457501 RepID=UPI003FD38C77